MTVSERDKVLAAAVHVGAIFFPYAVPGVVFLVSGSNPYVRYHAARAFIQEVVSALILGLFLVASLAYSIVSVKHVFEGGFDWSKINWTAMLIKSVMTWIVLSIWGFLNTVLNIHEAFKALEGRIPERLGRSKSLDRVIS